MLILVLIPASFQFQDVYLSHNMTNKLTLHLLVSLSKVLLMLCYNQVWRVLIVLIIIVQVQFSVQPQLKIVAVVKGHKRMCSGDIYT